MKLLTFTLHVTHLERVCFYIVFITAVLSKPSNQQAPQSSQQNNEQQQQQQQRAHSGASSVENETPSQPPISVPYFRASIPMRILECLRDFSTLRCTKLYVLQKMEERKQWPNTGNLTKDFLNQFFGDEEQMGSLISERFRKMTDKELNKRLVLYFQRFFKNRDIKMRFTPGLMVKVIPNEQNQLKLTWKKQKSKYFAKDQQKEEGRSVDAAGTKGTMSDSSLEGHDSASLDEDDIAGMKMKHRETKKKMKKDKGTSYKTTMLQMAVPVMMMPAILMGTFLPFVLPVLKMATITSMIMNNTAFIAALIYAARTHVNSQDEQPQPINYSYGLPSPGMHH